MPINPPVNAVNRFHGELFQAWTWEQELFDGSTHQFECITRQDSATIIPFLDSKTILLTRQEQPGRDPFIDVPGGRVDAGEDAETAARRELTEECGKRARHSAHWQTITHKGMVRYVQHIFLAADFEETSIHLDPGEKIELVPTPWSEAIQLALEGKMRQAHVMLALLQMEFHPHSRERLRAFLREARIA